MARRNNRQPIGSKDGNNFGVPSSSSNITSHDSSRSNAGHMTRNKRLQNIFSGSLRDSISGYEVPSFFYFSGDFLSGFEVTVLLSVILSIYLLLFHGRRWRFWNSSMVEPAVVENVVKNIQKPNVSIALNEILIKFLTENSADRKSEVSSTVLNQDEIGAFLTICNISELYVFVQISADEQQDLIVSQLCDIGALENGLKQHRIMFSSSTQGRASMVRQLQPKLHIESDLSVINTLQGKVRNLVYLRRVVTDNQRSGNVEGVTPSTVSQNSSREDARLESLEECIPLIHCLTMV